MSTCSILIRKLVCCIHLYEYSTVSYLLNTPIYDVQCKHKHRVLTELCSRWLAGREGDDGERRPVLRVRGHALPGALRVLARHARAARALQPFSCESEPQRSSSSSSFERGPVASRTRRASPHLLAAAMQPSRVRRRHTHLPLRIASAHFSFWCGFRTAAEAAAANGACCLPTERRHSIPRLLNARYSEFILLHLYESEILSFVNDGS